jgi:hypothetical protein
MVACNFGTKQKIALGKGWVYGNASSNWSDWVGGSNPIKLNFNPSKKQ